ncbi:glycosyltransferase [Niallia sp. 01092]|uniref:glycosyltransferase n=1 Tax=Niallia sp. 01092 TaxID=3457759 RepID=UPI003FD554E1
MNNKILLLCEAYGGGVKTHVDLINTYNKNINGNLYTMVSSKRIDKKEYDDKNYIWDDNLSFGKSPIKLLKALRNINYTVKENNINIIHAHSTFAGLLAYLFKKIYRTSNIKFIYTPHAYFSQKKLNRLQSYIIKTIERRFLKIQNLVIHVSQEEEKHALVNKLVNKTNSTIIYNGIPKGEIKKQNQDTINIINLARIDQQKNLFEFVEVANRVLEKTEKDVRFIIAGDGKLKSLIETRINQLRLEKKVILTGFIKNKEELFNKADIYFSTSLYEGLPYSVIEAMSYELPLVLSDVIGHNELIDKNGFLYSIGNIEQASECLLKLINNKALQINKGKESFRKFSLDYDINTMISKLKKVYV